MSMLKVKGRVNENGVLTAQLPRGRYEGMVDVLVEWQPGPVLSKEDFRRLLDESFGIMPDIERPKQGELPPPLEW